MAIMANISLGVWIFWSRFVKYMQKRRALLLHGVVLSGVFVPKNTRGKEAFNAILTQGAFDPNKKSHLSFLFCH
jgi:hypothetical protein